MKLNERIDQMKANLTEEDLKDFERDIKATLYIDRNFKTTRQVYKFLMLYIVTFVDNNDLDITDFVNDLARAQSAFSKLEGYKSKGH